MLSQTSVNESRSFIVKLLERDLTAEEVQREELQYPEEQQEKQEPEQEEEEYLILTVPFGQSVKVQFVPRSMHGAITSHWNRVMHMLDVVLNSTLELYTMERAACARLFMKEDKKEIPKEVIKAAELLFMSGMEVCEGNIHHEEHYSLSSLSQPPITSQRQRRRRYAQYNPEEVMRSVRWLIDLNFAETLFAAYLHAIRHHVELFLHVLCCVQAYLHEGFAICCNSNGTISHNIYVLFVLTTFWKQFRSALNEIATVSVFLNRWYICHYAGKKLLEEVGVNCLTELLTSPHQSVLAKKKKYKRHDGGVTRANNNNVNSKLSYSNQYHIDLDGDKINSNTNATEKYKEDDKLHKQEFCTLLPLAYSGFGELIEYELSSDVHAQELQQILHTETIISSRTANVQVFVNEFLSTSTFGNWRETEEGNKLNFINTNNKCSNDNVDTNKIIKANIGSEDEESDDNIFYTPRSQRSVSSAIPTTASVTAAGALLSEPENKHENVKTRENSSDTNIMEQHLQVLEKEQEMQNIENNEENDNYSQQGHSAKVKEAKKAMYSLFQEFVSLCTAMDVYNKTFMPSLQCTIEQYYTNITNTCEQQFHVQLVSASMYFSYVHCTLDAWKRRTFAYLHHNSWPILEEQIQKMFLDDRARAILKRDFAQCMQHMDNKTLSLAERLLSESTYIGDRQCVLNLFKNYVEQVGKHIMQTITEIATVKSSKRGSDALTTINATLQTKNMTIHDILLKILCNGTNSAHSRELLETSSSWSVANTIIAQWNVEFATVLSMLELLQTMNDMINRAFVHAKRDYSVKLNEALEIVLQVHSQQFALQLACFANAIMIYITRSHEEETKENEPYRYIEQSPTIKSKLTLEHECKLHNVHNKLKTSTTRYNSTLSPSPEPYTIHEEIQANQSTSRKRSRQSLECDRENKSEVEEDNENEEDVASSNDSIISNTSKTNMEAVHNDILHQISVLFAHTPDKLYFISIYEYQLAQRLLSLLYNVDSKWPSEWNEQYEEEEEGKEQEEMVEWELECKRRAILEQEKFFIDLIREICGASFTSRLDGMCKDFASAITTSNSNSNVNSDDTSNSNTIINYNSSKKIDSKLYLLTSSYWPSFFQPAKSNSVSDTAQSTCIEVDTNNNGNNGKSTNTHLANPNSMMEERAIHPLGSSINVTNESKSNKSELQTGSKESNNAQSLMSSSIPKVNGPVLHLPTEEWESLLTAKENEFYSTHDKRRIQWQHELSTATFTGQFVHNTCAGNNLHGNTNSFVEYTFHGSVLQCAILLTIDEHTRHNENEYDGITFATLCKLLGVPEHAQNIRAALMSLLSEPYQLIIFEERQTKDNQSEKEEEMNNTSELANTHTNNKIRAKYTLMYSHNNLRTPNNYNNLKKKEEQEEHYEKLLATSRIAINEHFYSPTHNVYLPMSRTTYKLFHANILQSAEESHETNTHTSSSSPSLELLPREDGGIESVAKGITNQNHDNANDSHKIKIDTEALLHKQVVESWVVTFMKRNNTSQHHVLLDFVKSKVKFDVSSTLFKSAIDWCVERGYLERIHTSTSTLDKSTSETNIDNDTYKYLS